MSASVQFDASAWPAGHPATTSSWANRWRTVLIVSLVMAVPVTQEFDLGGKHTLLAASDVILPFGLLFLAWQLLGSRLRLPLAIPFCLNIAAVTASLAFNFDTAAFLKGPVGVGIEVVKLIALWLVFFVLVNAIRTRTDFILALRCWLIAAVGVALIGIGGALAYQFAGIETGYSLMFRAQGTLGDANLFGCYLAASFYLTLLYRRLTGPTFWIFPAIAIYAAGIFFSASRGCMLAVGVTLVLLLAIGSSWKVRIAAFVPIALAAIVLVAIPNKNELLQSNPFTERLATATVSVDDDAAADRKELWVAALDNFYSSPVVGIGHGYSRRPSDYDAHETSQIHNTYLGLLSETGILGLISYMLVFGYSVPALWRERRGPGVLALMALATIAMSGLTLSLENFRGLWALLALLEAYRRTCSPFARPAEVRT